MGSRKELMMLFALDTLADFDENLERISDWVRWRASGCGMDVDSSEIVDALNGLIQNGFVTAYRLFPAGRPPEDVPGVPPVEELEDLDFRMTDEGRELQMSDTPLWPFDENNKLRTDWSIPKD